MRIEVNELVTEYFEKIKTTYPELSYDNIREIVLFPWYYVKKHIESGELDKIRIKYFGVFYVNKGRAERMLKEAQWRFDKGYISEKQYNKIKNNIETYLKNYNLEEEE